MANLILMIEPSDFDFNEETAKDNEFMVKSELSKFEIQQIVMKEFNDAVNILTNKGVDIIVIKYEENKKDDFDQIDLPDAVFPNNWISTDSQGNIILYPMYAKSRNKEKMLLRFVMEQFLDRNLVINKLVNLKFQDEILEGTGSIVIDHVSRIAFCCESQRAQKNIFNFWCQKFGYEGVFFEAFSSKNVPVYHTNVVLSIGEQFVVICLESIKQEQQQIVLNKLKQSKSDKTIILIDFQQMEKQFCANLLQIKNSNNQYCIIMSSTASKGFTSQQLIQLEKFGIIIPLKIDLIESIGGGSARCMLAEIFLQKK